ncbi:MAG: 5-oxoprolinase subunit PxpB [Deltaproteobacteria bacterium]|nr:5-oxoprolinase subunit PxpB [Deltaproteobacteria bacterium]MBW2106593.1 5-oxoprolinase subunit PxpB [Deltaproteobacteria bacterium]MBW2341124.1 5-oxoprolinase subunit PxpB [Deltaproteobacteria bacterium]
MLYDKFQYRIMGDRSVLVELGDEISPEVNRRVREFYAIILENPIEGLLEIVPAYRSFLIIYNPLKIDLFMIKTKMEALKKKIGKIKIPEPKTVEIPVVYGGKYGPDMEWVAQYHKISIEQVIQLHTGTTYQVYMIGFMPGFPYMGELPEGLATPRRETPRTVIPQGSVAIAQTQTGIYPAESPGGWQILGRTPLKLFNPLHSPPTLLEMGDLVQFFSIGEEVFKQWQQ